MPLAGDSRSEHSPATARGPTVDWMRMLRRAACLLALAGPACRPQTETTTGAAGSPRAGWPSELKFALGVNPHESDALLLNAPFARRIELATGLKVTFFIGTSFSSVVEAMRAKRIDGM